jgi:type IV secretory pathway TrbD component
MGRLAALIILASQVLLLRVVFDPTGANAIWFTFVGHPLLAVGFGLAFWALTKRLLREAAEKSDDTPKA